MEKIDETGIPGVYEPLQTWIGSSSRIAYVLHLVALAGFGWGILRARLLEPWVGWVTIGGRKNSQRNKNEVL